MPKITKAQGPSYDEGDARHVAPEQRAAEQGPVVPHGDHREVEGEINRAATETAVGEPETALQRHHAQEDEAAAQQYTEDGELIRRDDEAPDYGKWTKAQLNEELNRRGIEHDPKANNAVLIEELERDDERDTLSGVND